MCQNTSNTFDPLMEIMLDIKVQYLSSFIFGLLIICYVAFCLLHCIKKAGVGGRGFSNNQPDILCYVPLTLLISAEQDSSSFHSIRQLLFVHYNAPASQIVLMETTYITA